MTTIDPNEAAASKRTSAGRAGLMTVLVLLAAILALAQAAQAWVAWHDAAGPIEGLAAGELCSVQLANGQIYYGRFVDATSRQVRLRDVYYVQSVVEAQGAAPNNRLVNRHKTDWHAPETMIVPVDKVLMLEKVGDTSRLAQLIAQDQGAAASAPVR